MYSAMMADETLSISEPPYSAGTSALVRPISADFFQQLTSDVPFLVLDLLDGGQDFVGREFIGQLRDHLLIFVEVFRSEDVVEVVIFEQKASARGFRLRSGSCCRCCHKILA